ncbi:methyltransferase domain-containing protein [Nonomuraea sp. PA05]|uniref:class I SAM-dependent methyltransferase n=1 Tax=Nonomuraea sp. PA05 TaxID=2604466 RepID=UPI0011D8EFE3|nr:class I SAM-dependent methyltransferase [Nonomuraea sp. PA05]TYB54751.1 methyltransferase domain-containing protein [Nonomuraea sp. PA05]
MTFDHNDHYHARLLRLVPGGARTALDVGCGTGRFARRLAARGLQVDAVDPAAEVIEAAQLAPGVRYHRADITGMDLEEGRYDYISCLASIHHVPFGTVARLRDALAPGGVLAILGCYPEVSRADHAWSLAAVPVNAVARLATAGRGTPSPAPVKRPELPLTEIRREAAELLPGATIRRLLFWRYLLAYRKG